MTDELDQSPKPVIEYGTYAYKDQNIPSWNAEAEKLIDESCAPEALLPHFASPDIAVGYYAQSLARRNSLADCGDQCILCRAPTDQLAAEVEWRMVLVVSRTEMIVRGRLWPTVGANFSTFHPICRSCYRRWRDRVRVAVMSFIGVALTVALAILLAGAGYSLTKARSSFDFMAASVQMLIAIVFPIGVVALTIGVFYEKVIHSAMPRPLRKSIHWAAKHTGELKLIRRVSH